MGYSNLLFSKGDCVARLFGPSLDDGHQTLLLRSLWLQQSFVGFGSHWCGTHNLIWSLGSFSVLLTRHWIKLLLLLTSDSSCCGQLLLLLLLQVGQLLQGEGPISRNIGHNFSLFVWHDCHCRRRIESSLSSSSSWLLLGGCRSCCCCDSWGVDPHVFFALVSCPEGPLAVGADERPRLPVRRVDVAPDRVWGGEGQRALAALVHL